MFQDDGRGGGVSQPADPGAGSQARHAPGPGRGWGAPARCGSGVFKHVHLQVSGRWGRGWGGPAGCGSGVFTFR